MKYVFLIIGICCSAALAQPTLKVSEAAWRDLSADDRSIIQQKYLIETVDPESFGTILDNQGADRSTPGTNGGSILGGSIASATYIDKAFGNGNYSSKNHLGIMLLGGLLGSALDNKPQSQYQFRYAIRLGSGRVIYQDDFSSEPFSHPVGVCVFLPRISLAPEQQFCSQNSESLRSAHITSRAQPLIESLNSSASSIATVEKMSFNFELHTNPDPKKSISCKVNNLAPVRTSLEKCNIINGVILND